ncbi:hypothetical protein C4J81_05175 [Deltaproteobacteria bacterium Smac51]|nr:hypothetical protein C4J81_05175 [Deltaproteobacteria bacterium Smac51]
MIYRTAHRATYRNINSNLGNLSYRIAQLTNQIASEKRINTPSDDPSGAATVLGIRSTLSNIKQYQTNIAVSDLWLNDSGAAVQSIKETLDEIYAKAEQGATDTYNAEQRKIIANEVELLFQSLIQYGDTKIGDTYIFGGQSVSTQPFGLQVEAQKVIAGCQNSDKWTGKVVNYGDPAFNNRPDLPVHSQDFLIEVVQAGGVDSRYYTRVTEFNNATLKGSNYEFQFTSRNRQYNNTEVKFVTGAANKTTTGTTAGTAQNGIEFGGTVLPTNVNYVYGSSAGTTASWDANTNTMTVSLQTDGGKPPVSVASASTVINAVNLAIASAETAGVIPLGSITCNPLPGTTNSSGTVHAGSISYNNKTNVVVDGDQITVYLERDNDPPTGTGAIIATADDVLQALNAHPLANQMINVALIPAGSNSVVSPTASYTKLEAGEPYTLAQATVDPKGTQNGLVFSAKNDPNGVPSYVGEAGNRFSVEYVIDSNPFNKNGYLEYSATTGEFIVHAGVDEAIYNKIFIQVYNDPASGCYKDPIKANERALEYAITTTANDVKKMFESSASISKMVDVQVADGNSGEGKINSLAKTQFSEGYDQPAMFRVSQDGGKTWGPPMSFAASEYKTGDMFYNETLGHASTTTSLRGNANDLVFTAKQLGTWGNDLTVEYNVPRTKPSALEITCDPDRPWDICVSLAVDADGNILTTANDVMSAVNNHPIASQLVTADLANYHEGGNGIVTEMSCQVFSVGEPYEVDGKTVITKLGHATSNISFNYTAPDQKCPNIIFQSLDQGSDGNDIGIRYTTSADPSYYANAADANGNRQDFTSVRYDTVIENGVEKKVLVVHLATEEIPKCPDADKYPEAAQGWKEAYPLYSCTTSAIGVTTTAGAIVEALIKKNLEEPENALVWASLERYPDGEEAKVGVTDGTVWLEGGNETDDASNHGVNLQFLADGSALQVGDIFEVPVGWYRGDSENIDINAGSGYRNTMNVTGDQIFGNTAEEGNILDTIQRLIFALNNNDSEAIGKELPSIKSAIEKVTTLETSIGTRLIRNEFINTNLETSKYNAQSLQSTTEDAPFEELITNLKNAQTVYEAVLGATGLTNKLSLLNYI